MKDQAEGLRRLVKQQKEAARVIAVTSGKGGVGKTNIAVNLALALRERDFRVVLIDVDLGLANVDILLGITPAFNLGHVLRGERTMQEIMAEGPLGLKILSGGSGITDLANLNGWRLEVFIKSLELLNREFDFVILDTGAGIHRNVLSFVLAATEVLVVTTPEPTAITDAYGLLKVIRKQRPDAKVRLVVNMAKSPNEAQLVADKLNSVLLEYVQWEVEYLGYVLQESQTAKAVADQQPVLLAFPTAMSSRSFRRIAGILAGEQVDAASIGLKGFFSKVYDFLRTQ
ncbi:MAG: MinD/ParA family protein [Bacillota bacterium]|jgi:flagellar biosynthesis protein FlhG|nr:MinD/ParA family protein [Bacillota bacterium]